MRRHDTLRQRALIASLLHAGHTPSQIARSLGCSRQTVYRVVETGVSDRRDRARGSKTQYPNLKAVVAALRAEHPVTGPRMLFHILKRDPARWGWHDDVPSPATIGRVIQELGLANKPVGPRDKRRYPHDDVEGPGVLALDTWGPWHIRSTRLYLASVQDRATRFTAAVPSANIDYGGNGALIGFPQATWNVAIHVALAHFLRGQRLRCVMADNGVGLVPAFGTLPQATRCALAAGARVVFIPPAQPWRNGRLERVHYTWETEFFQQCTARTVDSLLAEFTDWLNWYNQHRPHSSLSYRAPAEAHEGYVPLRYGYWQLRPASEPEPVEGVVDAIRLVYPNGDIDVWGHRLRVVPELAGQFVRARFYVGPGHSTGEVLYEQAKDDILVVARFEHQLDVPGTGGPAWSLFVRSEPIAPVPAAPPNERLDLRRLASQQSRVLKRVSKLERELQRPGDAR